MGILIFTARVHDLIFQKSNLEYRLSKLTKKLRDVQQYAATVGNGSISIGDLFEFTEFNDGQNNELIWHFAHNSSLQYMQQNLPYMQQMWQQQMQGQQQNAQQAQQMQNYMMRTSIYAKAENVQHK